VNSEKESDHTRDPLTGLNWRTINWQTKDGNRVTLREVLRKKTKEKVEKEKAFIKFCGETG